MVIDLLTGTIVFITILLFFVFFIFYKRDMLIKIFSLDMTTPTNELKQQLEDTADTIIKRLENQISQLEYLLEEAEQKSSALESKLYLAEQLISKAETASHLKSETTNSGIDSSIDLDRTKDIQINEPLIISKENPNDRRQLILAMDSQGYNATEIAKATGIGKGEIMLLLQLNKR